MEWYWALIIDLAGSIAFVITMFVMYKWTEHCEKQELKKKGNWKKQPARYEPLKSQKEK